MGQRLSDKKKCRKTTYKVDNKAIKLDIFLSGYIDLFTVYRRNSTAVARSYLRGLLKCEKNHTNIERMVEMIPEIEYHQYHHFLSESNWDYAAVNKRTASGAAAFIGSLRAESGKPTGFIIDESSHLKKGRSSVGVARQYAGVAGKVENCQTGVYAALCNGSTVCITDTQLFLPQSWIDSPERCDKAGIPQKDRVFQTKPQIALKMIRNAVSQGVKFDWIGGDGLYGHNTELTHGLDAEKLFYVLDIHKDEKVYLGKPAIAAPERKSTKGKTPVQKKGDKPQIRVDKYQESLTESQWEKVLVRNTAKGPKYVFAHTVAVWHWDGKEDAARPRTLVITKTCEPNPQIKYSFSNGTTAGYTKKEYAYFQCNRYWVERGFDDAKNELGLSGYQVRKWNAWQHHQSLVMMAMLYMAQVKNENKQEFPLMSMRDARIMIIASLFSDKQTEDLLRNQMIKRHQKRQSDIDRHAMSD